MLKIIALLICLNCFLTLVYADTVPAQKINCSDDVCSLYALTDQGAKLVTSGTNKVMHAYEGAWMPGSTVFAGFDIDCGTSCDYGYIVNYKTGQVSDQTYLVYAINMEKQVIVLPDPDDSNLQTLLVRPFFCKKGIKIKRDFDPDNANAISAINFDKNGSLDLTYSAYPDFTQVTETIPIDYQKLFPENTANQPN